MRDTEVIFIGKKIESIKEMYKLGLPVPKCVFILSPNYIECDKKLCEYFEMFSLNKNQFFTIRTDTENSSMSCKRKLTATASEIIDLSHVWQKEGFQIILQEFIDEKDEVKSGNIMLHENEMVIEGAMAPHHIFTNGHALHFHAIVPRYDSYSYIVNNKYTQNKCFVIDEVHRLIRQAWKVPGNNKILEFSFFKNQKLYFWEIKHESRNH